MPCSTAGAFKNGLGGEGDVSWQRGLRYELVKLLNMKWLAWCVGKIVCAAHELFVAFRANASWYVSIAPYRAAVALSSMVTWAGLLAYTSDARVVRK